MTAQTPEAAAAKLHEQRPLAVLIQAFPTGLADPRTLDLMAELKAGANAQPDYQSLARDLERPAVAQVMGAIFEASPYLQGIVIRDLARLQRILQFTPEQHLADLCSNLRRQMFDAPDMVQAMRLLRLFKLEVALLTALCDLGRVWPVMRVTAALTDCADAAVQSSVRFLFSRASASGDWQPIDLLQPDLASGYFVLAMGKYGAFELNYSSDIDLIIFYDSVLTRVRDGVEPAAFFVRMTRDLVRLLSERTADGYVFRTDLRLRPDAGATQIALSTDAALHYYETVGQNWERAALIKARACAGDLEAGNALLEQLAPFVWRKYLDFAAIADVQAMKRQIHTHKGFGAIGVAGHDIKLGPGGIREIEFFVQTQQLIAGGRQPDLRTPDTRETLTRLVSAGWITEVVARQLDEAYQFLRTIEHRIQMVADEQTHRLPMGQQELERLAHFCGFADLQAFSSKLIGVLETVQGHYARLFEKSPELTTGASNMVFAGEADDPTTVATLAGWGYSQPQQVLATVRGWHHGRYRSMRSPKARERLTEVQPLLIEAFSQTADPDSALANFDRFLVDLPSGIQLFALLRTKPGLLQLIADIMGSAPRLARILSRRRRLFDAVLDPRAFGAMPGAAEFGRLLRQGVANVTDAEGVLDAARIVANEQMFLIGVRILVGTMPASDAGRVYADLADSVITFLHEHIERDLVRAHGRVPGGDAVVLALGKLGGREMTAASDLDLIVIYDAPADAMQGALLSDGARPLSAPQYYARLTQRLVAALSAPTSQGTLYDVDLRLRPSGQKGPLATSLASFVEYQRAEAWTWEHMALTRARVVSGQASLKNRVDTAIAAVLARPRDAKKTLNDVREMRDRIAAEKGTDDIWDLKQVRGGLVDLEFIAQALQLVHAAAHHEVLSTNTRKAIQKLTAAGVLRASDGERLDAAGLLLSNLTGLLRLLADGLFDPASCPRGLLDRLARAGAAPSFAVLEVLLTETLSDVRATYERLTAPDNL